VDVEDLKEVRIKNSTHSWDEVFGHGEWGIGHGEEVTNALFGHN